MVWAPAVMRVASSATTSLRQEVGECLSRNGAVLRALVNSAGTPAGGAGGAQDTAKYLRRLAAKVSELQEMNLFVTEGLEAHGEGEGWRRLRTALELLEEALPRFGLIPVSRTYREAFSDNYRVLFVTDRKLFRADIFEGCVLGHQAVTVNGNEHCMDTETLDKKMRLKRIWSKFATLVSQWDGSSGGSPSRSKTEELKRALVELDKAWASFEKEYVTFLIRLEAQERSAVTALAQQDDVVRRFEGLEDSATASEAGSQEHYSALQRLVKMVGRMNSVANMEGKGRNDLGAKIYVVAMRVLKERRSKTSSAGGLDPLQILAYAVRDSLTRFREYIRDAASDIDKVDPQLSRNPRLVACLMDWEESWEAASRYLVPVELRASMCDFTEAVRAARRLSPGFQKLLDHKDAELFLILPRLVLLCYSQDQATYGALLERMLPHRFHRRSAAAAPPLPDGAKGGNPVQEPARPVPELKRLVESFQGVVQVLHQARVAGSARSFAWDMLLKRAVAGSAQAEPLHSLLTPDHRASALAAVEKLFRTLESWSMELQRHSASEWNQYTAVFLHCLTGRKKAPRESASR